MLLMILLLEGFITISVEVLSIRQLIPFFGGSVVITSIIIGIFLLFLALGYWRGGSYRQDIFKQLSSNFILSMLWIGIGLSYTFIYIFYYCSVYKAKLPFLPSLFAYLLLVVAPIVYWLGQTVPLTTNLFSQQQRVSHISGKALFLSTIGSFLGALLTSLLLFQYVGVAWTVVVNCGLLLALVILIRDASQTALWKILLLFGAFLFIWHFNVHVERAQFQRTNNYANYRIVETNEFKKVLQINQSNSSLLTPDKKGYAYIEYIRSMLFQQLNLQNKKILVIGAGGFSLTAAGTHENAVTYVDIDPDIKTLAEKEFLKAPIKGHFIGQDARQFLRQSTASYDVILSDVYSHQSTIPAALLTVEYFQALAEHLNPEGLLIVNVIANPVFQSAYARIVFNSIHAVFPYCTIIPINWAQAATNLLYICPKVAAMERIYRDDLTTATTDFFRQGR